MRRDPGTTAAEGVTRVHQLGAGGDDDGGVPVIDVAALRPSADQVELVAGLLAEVGSATVAELCADLGLPLSTVAGVLRVLERWGRAQRTAEGGEHVDVGPRPLRRSWRVGGGQAG